jgi:leader peptidase (prepilin peptidase)/N-methyltransferase
MQFTGAVGITLSVFVFFFGLAVGSFLNVVIYRLPREGMSVSKPRRSFCPSCQSQLKWYDNLPLISYIFLKGRCRNCGFPISFRYPLVEIISALLAISLFSIENLSFRFFFYYYFLLALTAIAFIDLELMVIPDLLIFPTILLGLMISILSPNPLLTGEYIWDKLLALGWYRPLVSFVGAIFGALFGFFCLWIVAKGYKVWRGKKGLGEGDPLLLALIGTYLGWYSIFPVLFLSSLIALIAVFASVLGGKLPRDNKMGFMPIPFGPFLSLAAVIWLFYGPSITYWYFSLMQA